MSDKDANLFFETLCMDSDSSVFERKLRNQISRALNRLKAYKKETYDALQESRGKLAEAQKILDNLKGVPA
jgi:hypothetical protein